MRKMKTGLRLLLYCGKLLCAYVVSLPLRLLPKYQNIWLISERGDDGRDNGIRFFSYLNGRGVQARCYFVIHKSSKDYASASEAGKVVETDSWKHFILFALAKVRISTHAWGGDIPCVELFHALKLHRIIRKKTVFLQHGITKDHLPGLCYPIIKPDLFVCGALPEYRYIQAAFGHPESVVQYTGLARFDTLQQCQTKRQILLMPTFRKWLKSSGQDVFFQSEYYAAWQQLLCNPALMALLEKQNLQLVFYPHYEMQPYISAFRSENPRIQIADFNHFDVQQLLKESALLVTDFSSVFFDFAYMGKPVIYYQFDRERYIREHYDFTKGYFSYDAMGFGPVCFNAENLIKQIEASIQSGFAQEQAYADRTEQFFPVRDTQNCDRIYDAIQKMLNS